jgi:hypothetical protein
MLTLIVHPDIMPRRLELAMRFWIGVASRDHVEKGVEGGFCQLCHGKAAAMRKLSPGDAIIYYSPKSEIRGGDPVQAFTAIGRIKEGAAYSFDTGGGFAPFRRDVDFMPCHAAPIRPLIERLSFIRNKRAWGAAFRFGQIEINEADFRIIAEAMDAPSFSGAAS